MPRYELSEGTSNKFWQIDLTGASFTTTFGRIGAAGQASTKTFDTDAKALREYEKLIAEKTKKGYQLVGPGSAAVAGAAAPTPSAKPPAVPAPAPAAATAPAPAAAAPSAPGRPSVTVPSSPSPSTAASAPMMTISDAARRGAAEERKLVAIEARKAEDAAGKWLRGVHGPFVKIGKTSVQAGATRGDANSRRLCEAVLKEYGSLERMPATLDVETAAAGLQLMLLEGGANASKEPLVGFWVAHSGLGFALAAFAKSLWGYECELDRSASYHDPARSLKASADRKLAGLFQGRPDRALAAYWSGATDAERAAARERAGELRATGSLLERSALASATLDVAWIDADLREHATTGARAAFSPEALLVASSAADVATYVERLRDEDVEFYPSAAFRWGNHGVSVLAGYAWVERFGLAGIDIACARIHRSLPALVDEPYAAARVGESLRVLLEVARLAKYHPPVVAAALAVLQKAADSKLSKDTDPRPIAYECLKQSPELALPLVRAERGAWAKNLAPQLERLAGGTTDDRPEADPGTLPARLRGAAFKGPDFWQPEALSRIALRDGTLYPAAHLPGLGAALKTGDEETLAELARIAAPASLAAFGWDLFQAWLTSGAPSKERWAFTALGSLGDDQTARRLTPLIRAWPGESQHPRAVIGLDVLGAIGSDVALMMLNGIAQKVKFKGLQERAREKMDAVAEKRGMTADQLADRLVPDLDLEDDGSKTLDFGPRSFRVGFDETLSPFVVDASGTRLKDLPKPNSKDDAGLGEAATETWKAMKKDVRALAAIQITRLELAMGNARRWSGEEFKNFFVDHPLLTHLVRRLVWGVYEGGALARTFRVAEDRSYADVRDDATSVDGGATIGIAHRFHLADADTDGWAKLFGDYELAQPFEQLGRATYRLAPDEGAETGLARFEGRVIETKKLLGLLSRGWRKGQPQDAGCIFELYKPIHATLIASLPFEMGLNAGGMDYVEPTQKLGVVDFSPTEPSWGRRKDAIPLREVEEVVMSEVIRDVESLGPGVSA